MVNVHKAMREKSERNAAEHKKNCLDAEVSRYFLLQPVTENICVLVKYSCNTIYKAPYD